MDAYLDWLQQMVRQYSYVFLFLALFLESTFLVGFFFPGLLVLVIAGYFAGTGDMDFFSAALTGLVATVAGDNCSFFVARYLGTRWKRLRKALEGHKESVSRLHNEKPWLLVFFQFPFYFRIVLPAVFGFTGYPLSRWLLIDLIASPLFVVSFLSIGFFVGRTTKIFVEARRYSDFLQWGFLIFATLWLGRFLYAAWRTAKRNRTD